MTVPSLTIAWKNHTVWGLSAPAAVFVILLILLNIPVYANAGWQSREASLMGTRVTVGVVADEPRLATEAIDCALAEIRRIEQLMSTYIADSEISAVNRDASKDAVEVGEELFGLIETALHFSELSGGAFDITYESLGQHYDFFEQRRPDDETVQRARALIDYRLVILGKKARTIRFARDGVKINLGGIAKGYAIKRALAVIQRLGIESAMVTAGGDTALLGMRGDQPWTVGIQNPRDANDIAVRLPLADEAISTSGDYERYFEQDGVRYHHIFSPQDGASSSGVRSASVIGPDAVWTDALSTTVFVLGARAGLALIETLPEYEAIVVDQQQKMAFSSGFSDPDVGK